MNRALPRVVQMYVKSRTKDHAVSISAAVRAIRMVVPDAQVTTRDLVAAVAAETVRAGKAVDFDGPGGA